MTRTAVFNTCGSWIRSLLWMICVGTLLGSFPGREPLYASEQSGETQDGIGEFFERPAIDARAPAVSIQRDERVEWIGFPPVEPLDVAASEIEFRFSVKNLTTTSLRIEEFETGCGCMEAVFDRSPITPGGFREVRTHTPGGICGRSTEEAHAGYPGR